MDLSPGNNLPEDPIQRELEKLEEMNKKQEKRLQNLETKCTQVINLYFVFQGVILASISTASSSVQCHDWWIPFSLSLLAAALNLFYLFDNTSKILNSKAEIDQNKEDLALMKLYGMTRAQVSQVLPGTPLNHREVSEILRRKPGMVSRWKPRLLACLCIGSFIGFSAVVMYGCYTILCH